MAQFIFPREFHYGRGTMGMLRRCGGKRAVLVSTGHGGKRLDLPGMAKAMLEEAGMAVRSIPNATALPAAARIANGAKAMREFQPDWIVALGGGATLSAAKAMWALYEHPGMRVETLGREKSLPALRSKARLAALSTTSGTGAEATPECVFFLEGKAEPVILEHAALIPDLCLVDPMLAEETPIAQLAYSGMDALAHAVETLLSPAGGPACKAIAKEAGRRIMGNLARSFRGDLQGRAILHHAQCVAGIAHYNAGGGLLHTLSLYLEAALAPWRVPHGCISAILLPYVFCMQQPDTLADVREFAQMAGFGAGPELCKAFFEKQRALCIETGIPASFMAMGVEAHAYEKAAGAVLSGLRRKNMDIAREKELEKILLCAYKGGEYAAPGNI